MTVAELHTTPELAWLDAVEAGMGIPRHDTVGADVARSGLARIARVRAQLAADESRLIRIVDDAELAKQSGSTSTSSMLSKDFGGDQAAASRQVRTAKNLKVATLTETALAAGDITYEKAEVIARTMAGLPSSLDELTRIRVEKRLIADAKRLTLIDLRRRVLRVADIYRPRDEADLDEDAKLRHQEARAWQNTEFWIGQARDGLASIGGKIPELYAELLKNQVGAIAAPRRRHFDEAEQTRTDADEELSHSQRMGRAFCAWIERIPTDGLPATGGTPATLTVNLDYDPLAERVREAAGMLGSGTRISASEARRLACNHHILPRVLDGKSVPLDQGRSKRLFTPAQRLAMADRDGGCTRPGCDRPPAWCESHHIDQWAKNGLTNLNDGVLACAHDHHWAHANNIRIRIHCGHAEWLIDGVWQRNRRWRP